jgi:hypothetical protein
MLIGREKELKIFREALLSPESEMISVIGRRRVGKTFLVRHALADMIAFEMTGVQNGTLKEQLANFADQLTLFSKSPVPVKAPSSWLEAFRLLIHYFENTPQPGKPALFFDELPWLATRKSDFIKGLGYFWNSWASRKNVLVVICGSAASWMIQKIAQDKGGLHNRITRHIRLTPFTLQETEQYLLANGLNFDRYQIVQLYTALGGVPHYLKQVQKGESATQNIDRICFETSGLLRAEFDWLYPALFDQAGNHVALVKALAALPSGVTRNELLEVAKIPNGGGATKSLEELVQSDFVGQYFPFNRSKKDMLFRLTDEYSLFYLRFIENLQLKGSGIWQSLQQTPAYTAWSGYAFENVCLKHIAQIKKALGISGVFSTSSSFYQKGKDGMEGCQVDLVIDRNDAVINLCEIKFYNAEVIITKEMAASLRRKVTLFKHYTGTRKQISLTLITAFGMVENQHSTGLVDVVLTLDDLFG